MQYLGKPKGGQFQSLLFSLILVKINKPGAPLLGLAKSIYSASFSELVVGSQSKLPVCSQSHTPHKQSKYYYITTWRKIKTKLSSDSLDNKVLLINGGTQIGSVR